MRDPSPSYLGVVLGSPRSQAPQGTPPLPHLCPGHHTKGALHPSLQPRVVLQLPQRPSPRPPAFPKGWGAASFPLSLVSLRADKERVGVVMRVGPLTHPQEEDILEAALSPQ